jgi:divalent anion:Na+ symporter, DASS family
MDKKRILKSLFIIVVTLFLWFAPVPKGMKVAAWQYFAIYIACILGIVLNPFSPPVTILVILSLFSFITGPEVLLSGYAGSTLWLVFSAFLISEAFAATGLGNRIAYLLIGKFGKSTLGLGYALAFTDFLVSPATPSNTARTGGITWPIFSSVASALGSSSEKGTSKKIASYLTGLTLHVSLCTASLFITSMAVNAVIVSLAKSILHVEISWFLWFKAQIIPGLFMLFVLPLYMYKLNPPELKHIDNYKELSSDGLKSVGKMKIKEKILIILFIVALILWSTTNFTKLNTTTIALGFLAAALVTGVLTWKDVRGAHSAWDTFIWYGGILGISDKLVGAGFFSWLAARLQTVYDFKSLNPMVLLLILVLMGTLTRYLLTNAAAYCTTIIPVLFTIGLIGGVPPMRLALMLGYLASYCGILTHYGTLLVPLLVASGNVEKNSTWWKLGHITVGIAIVVYFVLGIPYWNLIGLH